MSHQMYQVSMVGVEGSSWELLAQSPEHAILTVQKFYPRTRDLKLVANELTLCGDVISLLHTLKYGETFHTILCTANGKPAIRGPEYVRGDFDPTRNLYQCYEIGAKTPIYIEPYAKIIKK